MSTTVRVDNQEKHRRNQDTAGKPNKNMELQTATKDTYNAAIGTWCYVATAMFLEARKATRAIAAQPRIFHQFPPVLLGSSEYLPSIVLGI